MPKKQKSQAKLKRMQTRFDRQRAEAERIEAKKAAFTETVPRPDNPGDRCWSCGDPVIYRETDRKPKPHQSYAYRGYLWCEGCKTLYHCERFKYALN